MRGRWEGLRSFPAARERATQALSPTPDIAGARMAKDRRDIKTASKAEEQKLLRNAKALEEDPQRLLPECVHDDADACYLRKLEGKLDKTHAKRDSDKKLERASGGWFGHDLPKALASTLLLAKDDEAPYLGRVRIGGRTIPFAKRGDAPKETLAAVQHHDDPWIRVMPLAKTIRKKDLHVYSCRSGWWCTGTEPAPPEAYVEAMVGELDHVDERGEGVHVCPHVPPDRVGEDGPAHLVLEWRTAGRTVAICDACAADRNTAVALARGIASPDPTGEFSAGVHLPIPECRGHEGACPAAEAHRGEVDTGGYLVGELSDDQLISHARRQVADRLTAGDRFFLAREVCYGDDVDALLADLKTSEVEEEALRAVLPTVRRPVVVGAATGNAVLSGIWDDHARDLVAAVADDGVADEVLAETDVRSTPPGEILREARDRHRLTSLADRLPSYDDLPKAAAVADEVARTYRLEGAREAARACEPGHDWGSRAKAVGYGCLLALGRAGGKEWKFTEEERESGEFIASEAETLLEAPADAYHEALSSVARAAGETRSFSPQDRAASGRSSSS